MKHVEARSNLSPTKPSTFLHPAGSNRFDNIITDNVASTLKDIGTLVELNLCEYADLVSDSSYTRC